jgi:hypothetical protein
MVLKRIIGWLFIPYVMVFIDWKQSNVFLKIYGISSLCLIFIFILAVATSENNKNGTTEKSVQTEPEKPKILTEEEKEELRKQKFKRCFSPWDGSHVNLKFYIQDNMNDPDSFEHVETVYQDMVSVLLVETTFRGKNQFGALVKNTVKARVSADENCTILKIISQR